MALQTDDVMAALPKGLILPWASKETKPPKGWALCDGKNGTPNLEGLFLRGTSNAGAVGNTGGSASQNHNHTVGKSGAPSGAGFQGEGDDCQIGQTSDVTINTIPPFYTVQYIIKL